MQPLPDPVPFVTGDKVKIVGNHYRAVNPPSGTVKIDDVDEDGDYLIDGNWYAHYDVVAADPPTVPDPPKFSSPEEADAWLEARLGGAPVEPALDPYNDGRWQVQVLKPDGTVAFSCGRHVIHRSDQEDVAAMLASAQAEFNNLPF